MRRPLYLALVLVFLAVVGLAFVRVTASPAFAVRLRLQRIQISMNQESASRVMADLPGGASSTSSPYYLLDYWEVQGYSLKVYYLYWPPYDDLYSARVWGVKVDSPDQTSMMDRALDWFGYEKVRGFAKKS